MKKHVPFLLSLVGLLACTTTVGAQTVTTTANSGTGSLRDEIALATSGDTIWFDASLEGATISITSAISVASNLVIMGFPQGDAVTVDGGFLSRLFSVNSAGTLKVYGVDFTRGNVSTGGALLNSGILELHYCRLYNNKSTIVAMNQGGGAIFNNTGATLLLDHCELFDNRANSTSQVGDAFGGALYNRGTLVTIDHCSFYDNLAFGQNVSAYGGAIYTTQTTNITSSTFSNNQSDGDAANTHGGAIVLSTNAQLSITNSTFSGNSCPGSGSKGGNIWNNGGLTLQNTIVANGFATAGPDIYTDPAAGTTTSLGNNILESNSTSNMTYLASDMAVDPQLDTLAYNGQAFTKTHALKCNSPAIDAGNSTGAPSSDQTDRVRVVGTIDIGAFELQAPPTIVQNGMTLSIPEQGYFQWYNGTTAIPGATDSVYTATANGDYHVDLLNVSGCPLSSNVVSIITVGILEKANQNAMKLFPNPASSVVTVSSDGLAEIQLLDLSGRVLKVQGASGQTNTDLDVSNFPSGVYFVKGIRNDGTQLSQRLMKQ